MDKTHDKENYPTMEKSIPVPGMQPPPYSSFEFPQDYNVNSSVSPTAPYPLMQNFDQVPPPMPVPPPYYFNAMPVGTLENGIPAVQLQSNHNPTYTPTIYNPVVTDTPTSSQQNPLCANAKNLLTRVSLVLVVIVILIIVGITINYFIEEVF